MVKTNPVSYLPPVTTDVLENVNLPCHRAIVLAVHDTSSTPKILHAILAPKEALNDIKTKWKVVKEIRKFDDPLKSEESVFFCVPLNDSDHLPLEDHTLR